MKLFLAIICLLAGAVWTQTSAQSLNAAIQGWGEMELWYTPVYCEGEVVDWIYGEMKFHYILKWNDGWWEIDQISGSFFSLNTNEVFKYREIGKVDYNSRTSTYHFNAIGDMGTHYIGFMEWDFSATPYVFTPIKVVCH